MKKLLFIVFIAAFAGLAFAFSPTVATTTNDLNNVSVLSDTTKTKKKTTTTTTKTSTTKKEGCSKSTKSCCSKSKSCDSDKKVK